jgi:hypothetical protein
MTETERERSSIEEAFVVVLWVVGGLLVFAILLYALFLANLLIFHVPFSTR